MHQNIRGKVSIFMQLQYTTAIEVRLIHIFVSIAVVGLSPFWGLRRKREGMGREGVDVGLGRSGLWLRTEEGKGGVLSVVGAAECEKIFYFIFYMCKIPVQ